MKSNAFGLISEYAVMFCYIMKLYSILRHRFRSCAGEIDIIASRYNYIVFIEVKGRKHGIHDYIISYQQQRRISKSALLFINSNKKYYNYSLRFDLAIVRPYKLPLIIENAWPK